MLRILCQGQIGLVDLLVCVISLVLRWMNLILNWTSTWSFTFYEILVRVIRVSHLKLGISRLVAGKRELLKSCCSRIYTSLKNVDFSWLFSPVSSGQCFIVPFFHKKYATYWKVLLGSWSLQNSARTQVYFGCSENRGVTVFRKQW